MSLLQSWRRSRFHPIHRMPYSTTSITQKFNILFLGGDEFSCLVFTQLFSAQDVWQNISVVTQPDTKTGRYGTKLAVSPLKTLLGTLPSASSIPLHYIPAEKRDWKHWKIPKPFVVSATATPAPTHLLVTASFGRIIPNLFLSAFLPRHRLNVHPSLLPAYRGPAPIQRAMISGEKETGVSVIEIAERKMGIDAGDIYKQSRVAIPAGCMFPALRDSLAEEGGRVLVSVLREMLNNEEHATSQALIANVPFAPAITGYDAVVEFHSMTADEVVRRHRAISHQKRIKTLLPDYRHLRLDSPSVFHPDASSPPSYLPARLGSGYFHPPTSSLIIRCAHDTFLTVPHVQEQDRRLIGAKEWWNGVRKEWKSEESGEKVIRFVGRENMWNEVGFLKLGHSSVKKAILDNWGKHKPEGSLSGSP